MQVSCVQSGSEPPSSRPSHIRWLRWSTRRPACHLSCWMALATAAGCGTGETTSECSHPYASEDELQILTWWQTEPATQCGPDAVGEVCAGQTLTDGYEACTATAEVALVQQADRSDTLLAIKDKVASDGAIINGASDLVGMAACDGMEEPSIAQLGTLEVPDAEFLVDRTPAELQSLVTCPDGRRFGMVVGLHSLNQLFYNSSVLTSPEVLGRLADLQIDLNGPVDIRRLPSLLKALEDAGYHKPLVIKNDAGTWSRFLVENLMVGLSSTDAYGHNGYEHFWSRLSGGAGSDHTIDLTLFQEALDLAENLAPYIQTSSTPIADIADSTGQGGVFTIDGDWAVPSLPEGVDSRSFPGTEGYYVYTSDVAVVTRRHGGPLDVDITAPIIGWLKAITSAPVQADFARRKNALSPVTSADGATRAKTSDELFVVDGKRLVGIPGLPSYVPYRSFDLLEREIQGYMSCLVKGVSNLEQSSAGLSDEELAQQAAASCGEDHAQLLDYVREQYCTVISGTADGCVDVATRVRREPR